MRASVPVLLHFDAAQHQFARFGIERFLKLADRFRAWGETGGYRIHHVAHSSDEITLDVGRYLDLGVAAQSKLLVSGGRTGGLAFKSDDEILVWLERWRREGNALVHGSFAGSGNVHDWWNNRAGDYEFLLRIQRLAHEMGQGIGQSIFLARNTLPTVERLLADLDSISPKVDHRWAFLPAYLGRARNIAAEAQRLTERERDDLPQCLRSLPHFSTEKWKSEREWLRDAGEGWDLAPVHQLELYVEDSNIDRLESAACDEAVEDLIARVRAAYDSIPSAEELAARWGSCDGLGIYPSAEAVTTLWFDRWWRAQGKPFDERLAFTSSLRVQASA